MQTEVASEPHERESWKMGSDSRNSNVPGGRLPVQIPAASKKIVQSLRELVGKKCTDSEIYAVLLECHMDPDDAAQRLLSQDTFHEVKSKRKRRKEKKETQELRAAPSNSGISNLGARLGNEHTVGRTGSTENNYNELGEAAYKREIATAGPSVCSSLSHVYRPTGKIINEQPSTLSNFFNADDRRQSIGAGDSISSSVQHSPGLRPAWPGVSRGRASMADIVRRGMPQNRGSQMSSEILPYTPQHAASTNASNYCVEPAQTLSPPESTMHRDLHPPHPSNLSEMTHESSMTADQHDFDNKWPVIEDLTAASGSSVLDTSAASDVEVNSNHSFLDSDRAKLSRSTQSNKVQVSESDLNSQNLSTARSASAPTGQIFANVAGGASDDDLLKETSSYDSHNRHMSKLLEGMGTGSDLLFCNRSASLKDDAILAVSSAAVNLQQLNIGREDPAMPPPDDTGAVVLPNFLQAFASDCSHLSFGTYKSGVASASPMPIASNPVKSNLEVSAAVDGSSAVNLNMRNSGYSDHEHLPSMYDTPRSTAAIRNYESLASSQSELKTQDTPEATRVDSYISPLLMPESSIKNIQQSSPKSSFVINPNARKLPPSPSELSLRVRDSSQFHASQSWPSRYSIPMTSISPPNPMPEALNSSTFSLPELSSQPLPGSNLVIETADPRLMLEHAYSQPSLPSEELVCGYPSMPRNQTYVPSALQQAYQDTSAFHDSLSGINYDRPQYRSRATVSNLPLSNNSSSGYRNFVGNSTNIPGSLWHNLSTSPRGTAVGYGDGNRSQYRDGNRFPPFQQNIRSSRWDSGIGFPTMLNPGSAYYSLLRQNPQHAGYQHGQQASQRYESLGYPNMYRSQTDETRPSSRKPL